MEIVFFFKELSKEFDLFFWYAAQGFFQLINSENILDDFWYAVQGFFLKLINSEFCGGGGGLLTTSPGY